MRRATGIIPARYSAARFPGKPLAIIAGKTMIQRVYEQAQKAKLVEQIIIATDDERVFSASRAFGADVRMTSPDHRSGTERVAEVAEGVENSIIINITTSKNAWICVFEIEDMSTPTLSSTRI